MFWTSERRIREMVREEIVNIYLNQSTNRMKRTYDEQGNLVESDYIYSSNLEHVVHFITKNVGSETKFFVTHSRTLDGSETIRKNGENEEALDRKYNEEQIFERTHSIPFGYTINKGVIVPNR
jgi:hypothetical protein